MTAEQAKERLLEKIVGLQRLKGTEICSIPELVIDLQGFDIPELLNEMVKEGQIMEIEYVLPEMNWRVKSFYLPAGTEARIA